MTLARTKQDQGGEVVTVFVSLVMHVDERFDRVGTETVEVEDHGVRRSLAITFRGAFSVRDENDPIAHLRQRLAKCVQDVGLVLDAEQVLLPLHVLVADRRRCRRSKGMANLSVTPPAGPRPCRAGG